MKMGKIQLPLATLLLLPLVFALGWWTRGINYERELRMAIEREALDSGGVYIPEMGIIRGDGITADKLKAMSPEAKEEMERRLKYYAENFPHDAVKDSKRQSSSSKTETTLFPNGGFSGFGSGAGSGSKVSNGK